uniref:Histone-lysine N-methyltransferase, H3 lysine-79 specific n=1 Tax=Rhabditophanes sp. KR3021 TaxID=114890 RepID=A0AC35TGM8_9BILA
MSDAAARKAAEEHAKSEKKIKLCSPFGGDTLHYFWNFSDRNLPIITEIVDLVRSIISKIKEIETSLRNSGHEDITVEKYQSVENIRALSKAFNKAAKDYGRYFHTLKRSETKFLGSSAEQLQTILVRSYNKAVTHVTALNKYYEAFSSETYGETSWKRMETILPQLGLTDKDVFVDLGSGVGQIVCHVAGGSKVKLAVGIEIADLPSRYAENMKEEFQKSMKWHSKKFREFRLEKGNFLDNKYRPLILEQATVLFINNYAFSSDLDFAIKQYIISELKQGTRIISTKPFAVTKEINDRTLSDVSSILDITEFNEIEGAASWTNGHVAYYLQTINRTRLEEFYAKKKKMNDSMKVRATSRSSSVSEGTKEKLNLLCVKEREIARAILPKPSEESDRKNHKELHKELIKDHHKESIKDHHKESIKDHHKESIKDHHKDSHKDSHKSQHKDSHRDPHKEQHKVKHRNSIGDGSSAGDEIYGTTTRRQWKTLIGGNEPEKRHSSSSNEGIEDASTSQRRDSLDSKRDLVEKAAKIKHGSRGRPRKHPLESSASVSSKFNQDEMKSLDELQRMGLETVEKVAKDKSIDNSLVHGNLKVHKVKSKERSDHPKVESSKHKERDIFSDTCSTEKADRRRSKGSRKASATTSQIEFDTTESLLHLAEPPVPPIIPKPLIIAPVLNEATTFTSPLPHPSTSVQALLTAKTIMVPVDSGLNGNLFTNNSIISPSQKRALFAKGDDGTSSFDVEMESVSRRNSISEFSQASQQSRTSSFSTKTIDTPQPTKNEENICMEPKEDANESVNDYNGGFARASENPEIIRYVDEYLEDQKNAMYAFIDLMYTEDFKKSTEVRIMREKQAIELKMSRIKALKSMISHQQEEGKALLSDMLTHVGISAKTAPEFIEAAKCIVEQNKFQQKKITNLRKEVFNAEKAQKDLQAKLFAKTVHDNHIMDAINTVANENLEDSINSVVNSVACNNGLIVGRVVGSEQANGDLKKARARAPIRTPASKKITPVQRKVVEKVQEGGEKEVTQKVDMILSSIREIKKGQDTSKPSKGRNEKKRSAPSLPTNSALLSPLKKRKMNSSSTTPISDNDPTNVFNFPKELSYE